jgi:hypothetical protein
LIDTKTDTELEPPFSEKDVFRLLSLMREYKVSLTTLDDKDRFPDRVSEITEKAIGILHDNNKTHDFPSLYPEHMEKPQKRTLIDMLLNRTVDVNTSSQFEQEKEFNKGVVKVAQFINDTFKGGIETSDKEQYANLVWTNLNPPNAKSEKNVSTSLESQAKQFFDGWADLPQKWIAEQDRILSNIVEGKDSPLDREVDVSSLVKSFDKSNSPEAFKDNALLAHHELKNGRIKVLMDEVAVYIAVSRKVEPASQAYEAVDRAQNNAGYQLRELKGAARILRVLSEKPLNNAELIQHGNANGNNDKQLFVASTNDAVVSAFLDLHRADVESKDPELGEKLRSSAHAKASNADKSTQNCAPVGHTKGAKAVEELGKNLQESGIPRK